MLAILIGVRCRTTRMENRSRSVSSINLPSHLLPYTALKISDHSLGLPPGNHATGSIIYSWYPWGKTGPQKREEPAPGHLAFKGQNLDYMYILWAARLKS